MSAPPCSSPRPDQALRRPHGLRRRLLRSRSRRGAGHRRRIRLRQVDAALADRHRARPRFGHVAYRMRDGVMRDLADLSEAERRALMRTDWGFVRQTRPRACAWRSRPAAMSASGDGGRRPPFRHHPRHGARLARQGRDRRRPGRRSADAVHGGMRQRLQIARNLVTGPRLVLMDEPTSGLDCLGPGAPSRPDRGLVAELGLAVIIVTHDLAVARLLSHRVMVMRAGRVIETGLTDQVSRRSRRALHPAPRVIGARRMNPLSNSATSPRPSRCTCAAACSCR